ncbi:hypothetical protein [Nocardioides convexus]|uniref:hypothetical protein n=1 Tax=Nocardioides convexus TaxID=2712224 RepID=UPI0024184CB7|nr:hypothetical protein [Nocardioides convexus]
MLDTFTLRVAFGLVAACVLVLFYFATYRTTRSAYSGWWCVSLGCFVTGAMLYLCNGTPVQVVANPLGNTIGVLGAAGVWAAARSLSGRSVPWRRAAAGAGGRAGALRARGPRARRVVGWGGVPAGDGGARGLLLLGACTACCASAGPTPSPGRRRSTSPSPRCAWPRARSVPSTCCAPWSSWRSAPTTRSSWSASARSRPPC